MFHYPEPFKLAFMESTVNQWESAGPSRYIYLLHFCTKKKHDIENPIIFEGIFQEKMRIFQPAIC